eukprot:3679749-Amphidinium_carterae.1
MAFKLWPLTINLEMASPTFEMRMDTCAHRDPTHSQESHQPHNACQNEQFFGCTRPLFTADPS